MAPRRVLYPCDRGHRGDLAGVDARERGGEERAVGIAGHVDAVAVDAQRGVDGVQQPADEGDVLPGEPQLPDQRRLGDLRRDRDEPVRVAVRAELGNLHLERGRLAPPVQVDDDRQRHPARIRRRDLAHEAALIAPRCE